MTFGYVTLLHTHSLSIYHLFGISNWYMCVCKEKKHHHRNERFQHERNYKIQRKIPNKIFGSGAFSFSIAIAKTACYTLNASCDCEITTTHGLFLEAFFQEIVNWNEIIKTFHRRRRRKKNLYSMAHLQLRFKSSIIKLLKQPVTRSHVQETTDTTDTTHTHTQKNNNNSHTN